MKLIYSSIININDLDDNEEYKDYSYDEKYNILEKINENDFNVEYDNLNLPLNNHIIAFGTLGMWDGVKLGYKILKPNLNEILSYGNGYDDMEIYCDSNNVLGKLYHHDGVHHLYFKEIREDKINMDISDFFYHKLIDPKPMKKKKMDSKTIEKLKNEALINFENERINKINNFINKFLGKDNDKNNNIDDMINISNAIVDIINYKKYMKNYDKYIENYINNYIIDEQKKLYYNKFNGSRIQSIQKYTKSLRPYVAKIYGWKNSKKKGIL